MTWLQRLWVWIRLDRDVQKQRIKSALTRLWRHIRGKVDTHLEDNH